MNRAGTRWSGGLLLCVALWPGAASVLLAADEPFSIRGGRQNATGAGPAAAPLFEWPGACPAECCGYGTMWTAKEETPAASEALVASAAPALPPAFVIPAGAVVRAVTGNLYTIETGTARVDEDFSTDATYKDFSTRHKQPVTFHAGDTIELLAPRGNGVYRIAHDGQAIDANLYRVGPPESCAAPGARCAAVITKPPAIEWWVMVLNAELQAGWIKDPRAFTRGSCR
jgi:hypothetical protein